MKNKKGVARSPAVPPSAIPLKAQVLVFKPELTHSVWTDFVSRARTQAGLEKQLRAAVRSGEYVGYRLHRIECEFIGATWPRE